MGRNDKMYKEFGSK